MRPLTSVTILFCLVLAACDATVGGTGTSDATEVTTTTSAPADATSPVETSDAATSTSAAAPPDADETQTVALVDIPQEPPLWEDVVIKTEDGLELTARLWSGNDVAVLHLHDFDNPTPGSAGQRPPQNADSILPYSAALVSQGFTVLSPEWRGHGESDGEFEPQASPSDLAAFHGYLRDAGYETIVVVGWLGAATASIVTANETDGFEVEGIAFLFSPPQDHGLDADAVLDEVDVPTLFIGSQAGRSASWSNRMGNKALDTIDVFNFERVPSGLQFIDIFGPELAGRIVEFVKAATT